MTRIFLHLIFAFLSIGFVSCGGDNKKGDFTIEGQWQVYERVVDCTTTSDDIALQNEAEAIGKELTLGNPQYGILGFQPGIKNKTRKYTYTFEDYAIPGGGFEFVEEMYMVDQGKNKSLRGEYVSKGNIHEVSVSFGLSDGWRFNLEASDLNSEHVMFTQELGAKDLENVYYHYFSTDKTGAIDPSIKGKMVTKAWRIKK